MLSQHQAPKKNPFLYLSQRQPGAIYDPNTLYSQHYSGSCTVEGEVRRFFHRISRMPHARRVCNAAFLIVNVRQPQLVRADAERR